MNETYNQNLNGNLGKLGGHRGNASSGKTGRRHREVAEVPRELGLNCGRGLLTDSNTMLNNRLQPIARRESNHGAGHVKPLWRRN